MRRIFGKRICKVIMTACCMFAFTFIAAQTVKADVVSPEAEGLTKPAVVSAEAEGLTKLSVVSEEEDKVDKLIEQMQTHTKNINRLKTKYSELKESYEAALQTSNKARVEINRGQLLPLLEKLEGYKKILTVNQTELTEAVRKDIELDTLASKKKVIKLQKEQRQILKQINSILSDIIELL